MGAAAMPVANVRGAGAASWGPARAGLVEVLARRFQAWSPGMEAPSTEVPSVEVPWTSESWHGGS